MSEDGESRRTLSLLVIRLSVYVYSVVSVSF